MVQTRKKEYGDPWEQQQHTGNVQASTSPIQSAPPREASTSLAGSTKQQTQFSIPMSKLFDNPTFDASQRISSPDVNQSTATNDSFTSEVPKKGWIENVTNRFQNLTLGKNIRNSGRSAQQDAETKNTPKPASTSICNLGMMPQVPPDVATDWKVYYVINLEPGRTVKIPKHPSWLPERLRTTEQFEEVLDGGAATPL